MKKKKFFLVLALALIISFGFILILKKKLTSANPYLLFIDEVYETISQNYWEKLSEEQLVNLFVSASQKASGQTQTINQPQKKQLLQLLSRKLKKIPEPEKKKELVAQIADIALANLQPFGRSRLYTQKEETALVQAVNNITQADHYQALEVDKQASQETIAKAYEEKRQDLEKSQTLQGEQELAQIEKAYETLKEAENRVLYDQVGIEPTMSSRLLQPEILYLKISKFSPTTLEELERLTKKADQGESLNTLILDLRDNIGGAIDGLPYFLGPFIGNNQYAYQFFHQEETTDFKTKSGWLAGLVRYKKVVILINENTQSSAEVMAATLKKYNVGVLLGKTTKGWGTVERVFPLKTQISNQEKFSVFLVHSLTLRDDNQPIEGLGVEPLINLESQNWERELLKYFSSPQLIASLKEIL